MRSVAKVGGAESCVQAGEAEMTAQLQHDRPYLNERKSVIEHASDILSRSVCISQQPINLAATDSCRNRYRLPPCLSAIRAVGTLQIEDLILQPALKVCRIDEAHTVDYVSDAGRF